MPRWLLVMHWPLYTLLRQYRRWWIYVNSPEKRKKYSDRFPGTAPAAINSQLFLNSHGEIVPQLAEKSYLSVGIPGTVMGLNTALKKYGTMSLSKVMAPAIQLAQEGFILDNDDLAILNAKPDDFKQHANVAKIFLKNNQPYRSGDRLRQPEWPRL